MASSRRDLFSGPLAAHHPSDADHVSLNHSPAPAAASLEDLEWPFGFIDGLDRDSIRETAYEIFFTSCRSSPGFSTRSVPGLHLSSHQEAGGNGGGDGGMGSSGTPRASGVGMAPTSRVKKALGLKMLRRSPSKRMTSGRMGAGATNNPTSPSWHSAGGGGGGSGPLSSVGLVQTVPLTRTRRPLTSAEIMRQQMRVTEQSDNRLRKTLTRTLVGQTGRRAETIVLPLELLRHIKSSEFSDSQEYHAWQRRQLKVLELGLLLYPSIPIEKSNAVAARLHEVIRAGESRPLDTSKYSDSMRTLCNSVVSLAWRSTSGAAGTVAPDSCHWADGYPLNIRIYMALLQSVFDVRDETAVLDEVDELFELMKKTWSTLGITRPIHNVCFAWALFHQYVATSEMEPDLLHASHAMLSEVSKDVRRPDGREGIFMRILSSVLSSMRDWSVKRLHHYHDYFQRGTIGLIENILPLAITVSKIMGEDVPLSGLEGGNDPKGDSEEGSSMDRVAYCIRSSLDNAFTKILETTNYRHTVESRHEASEALLQLAKETEDLALREREYFSPILKKWHPNAVGIAAVVLHNCYEKLLKQFLCGPVKLTRDCVDVLQRAGKLENFLVQMVVEDVSTDSDEGASGKAIVREMVPYDVDSVILKLLKLWIDDKMKKGKDCLRRAREVETWNPKSKTEPYAQSAVQLMKTVKETVEEFFELPIGITEDLIQDLADDLGHLFQDYISFAASCGSKQSYLPSLPPLTRCHRDSRFMKLFKRAAPCSILPVDDRPLNGGSVCGASNDGHSPRPSTSRGTQRIYIRLNSLHYLLTYIHSLNKTLTLSPRVSPARSRFINRRRRQQGGNSSYYFDVAKSSIQSACQHVCEVAAYRLIFLDSSSAFYESLYTGGVTTARIQPILRILKQNLALMCVTLTDRAQPQAMREVMKVSFEAFLMVLLAGGNDRVFYQSDYKMIKEDFAGLKRVISTCSEGLVPDETVERDAESVEGVIALMGQPTEQLIEDFTIVTCEAGGIGMLGQKLPMPPTTRRWHRSDPNTILRVLCHRNDHLSKQFLKKSFQLAKRK
ncbi:hypothetical protein SAY87_003936 [Trapa incisa]|uniref:Uncharacterized protein n=1 Tax=Trapa incisa TaxID=236973 RepID=A0AAN7PL41_9MYRT|nr:hypothetical protein SAY87_003936 [Trapa incisa]